MRVFGAGALGILETMVSTAELKRTAISQALIAQMCAVKVITFKEAVDVEEPTETETASGVTQPATEGTEEETTEEKE